MKKNKIVGITFGSFDLCHFGHALMFEECKEFCDYLIVGVQSDPSIDRPEKNRPIQSHKERMGIVSSLKFVDEIIPYDTEADLIGLSAPAINLIVLSTINDDTLLFIFLEECNKVGI